MFLKSKADILIIKRKQRSNLMNSSLRSKGTKIESYDRLRKNLIYQNT